MRLLTSCGLRCQHLLLRAHTAPPAAPRVFATATRTPYMVFFEAVELAHHEVSPPKTSRHLRVFPARLESLDCQVNTPNSAPKAAATSHSFAFV